MLLRSDSRYCRCLRRCYFKPAVISQRKPLGLALLPELLTTNWRVLVPVTKPELMVKLLNDWKPLLTFVATVLPLRMIAVTELSPATCPLIVSVVASPLAVNVVWYV